MASLRLVLKAWITRCGFGLTPAPPSLLVPWYCLAVHRLVVRRSFVSGLRLSFLWSTAIREHDDISNTTNIGSHVLRITAA